MESINAGLPSSWGCILHLSDGACAVVTWNISGFRKWRSKDTCSDCSILFGGHALSGDYWGCPQGCNQVANTIEELQSPGVKSHSDGTTHLGGNWDSDCPVCVLGGSVDMDKRLGLLGIIQLSWLLHPSWNALYLYFSIYPFPLAFPSQCRMDAFSFFLTFCFLNIGISLISVLAVFSFYSAHSHLSEWSHLLP